MARRRMLYGGEKEELIELPDYWRIDVTTTEENEQVKVGYYSLNPSQLADVIVDGVSNKSFAVNGSSAYINIAQPGNHIIYIKINLPYSNSSYYVGFDEGRTITYVRVPYNWNKDIYLSGGVKINRLDTLRAKLPLKANSYTWSWNIDELRVPKGNLEYYQTTQYNGKNTMWTKAKSIVECNFKYETT